MKRLLAWIIGIAFFAQFMCGVSFSLNYNGEKAKKTFWDRTMVIAKRIGDFKQAIFR